VRHRRPRKFIDLHAILVGEAHARLFKSEPSDIGPAAKREHDPVDYNRTTARKARDETTFRRLDSLDHLAANDLDTALFHFGTQMGANVVIEAAQDVFTAINHRYARAE